MIGMFAGLMSAVFVNFAIAQWVDSDTTVYKCLIANGCLFLMIWAVVSV